MADGFGSRDYTRTETIVGPATALGGGVAIVRISGSKAFQIAEKCLAFHRATTDRVDRTAYAVDVIQEGKPISVSVERARSSPHTLDEGLFFKFTGPKSFTGEDVVELHVHGGKHSVEQIIQLVISHGAQMVLPGEFSFRAVRNGKMTLSQAKGVAELIASKNDFASRLAVSKIKGLEQKRFEKITEELKTLASLSELGIDFSDQDVESLSMATLKGRVSKLIPELLLILSTFERGKVIQEGIQTAFVGQPNAGKSSLFNAILGQERSIVTAEAGTTRDVVHETFNLRTDRGQVTLKLLDTAGLRETENEAEKKGVTRTLTAVKEADLVLVVIDGVNAFKEIRSKAGRSDGSQRTEEVINLASAEVQLPPGCSALVVFTKADLLSNEAKQFFVGKQVMFGTLARPLPSFLVSSETMDGIHELAHGAKGIVETVLGIIKPSNEDEVILTRKEDAEALQACIESLRRSLNAPEVDLFASDIRQGLFALRPIIGEYGIDDILGKIFSEFCIGK